MVPGLSDYTITLYILNWMMKLLQISDDLIKQGQAEDVAMTDRQTDGYYWPVVTWRQWGSGVGAEVEVKDAD